MNPSWPLAFECEDAWCAHSRRRNSLSWKRLRILLGGLQLPSGRPKSGDLLCWLFTKRNEPQLQALFEGCSDPLQHNQGMPFVISVFESSNDGLLRSNQGFCELPLGETCLGACVVDHLGYFEVDLGLNDACLYLFVLTGNPIKTFPVHSSSLPCLSFPLLNTSAVGGAACPSSHKVACGPLKDFLKLLDRNSRLVEDLT